MSWRGTLQINSRISSLANPQPNDVPNPVRLAIAGPGNPFEAATGFFRNSNPPFLSGERIRVDGATRMVGNIEVIFMTDAQRVLSEVAAAAARRPASAGGQKPSARKAGGGRATAKKAGTGSKRAATKESSGKPAGKQAKTRKNTSAKASSKKSVKTAGKGKPKKSAAKRGGRR